MNGAELARAIRKHPLLGALPLVILSSSPLERHELAGLAISALLMKPARQPQLHDAIVEAISGPISEPRPRQAVMAPEGPPGAPAADAPLVLVAEDNQINQTVAIALLAKRGLRTATARSGREAVEMALVEDYAAVFMDCQMPELDGYEATRQIRAAESDRRVPIIAMTAHSMPGDRERCLSAGMDDYLSKPVRVGALTAVIKRWLPGYESTPRSRGASSARTPDFLPSLEHVADVLDRATILELQATLTTETREQLIEAFETSLPIYLADIEAAVGRSDQSGIRRLAHLLKGSSTAIGATRLTLSCEQLEHGAAGAQTADDEAQLASLRAAASDASVALRTQLRGTTSNVATG
jgi:CheY-like chemotaxis protein/HPt (histidine-containing phosphotransfer) domain-containing protein